MSKPWPYDQVLALERGWMKLHAEASAERDHLKAQLAGALEAQAVATQMLDRVAAQRDEARATVREENERSARLLAERDARIEVLEGALRAQINDLALRIGDALFGHTGPKGVIALEIMQAHARAALTPPTKEET